MGVIISDLLVVLTFSDHPENRAEMRISKDHNKDQGVVQISKDHNKDQGVVQISAIQKEARTQGNRILVHQGIQVLGSPQEVLMSENPITTDLVSNDRQTDLEVKIQEVREDQVIVKGEETFSTLKFPASLKVYLSGE
jgi:hypothetical protein